MRLLKTYLLLAPSLVIVGCKPQEVVEAPEMMLVNEVVQKTINDNGKELKVKVGQEISLSLPENRTTGYQWQLSSGELLSVTSDVYVAEVDAGQVGTGGMREYLLVAETEGQGQLSAKYVRPWEKDVAPEQKFEMKVIVE